MVSIVSTRTVRLGEETEKILHQIVQITGLSVSSVLKKGLLTLHEDLGRHTQRTPYDVYKELDLGPGGYAIAPSTESRRGVREAIRKKLKK